MTLIFLLKRLIIFFYKKTDKTAVYQSDGHCSKSSYRCYNYIWYDFKSGIYCHLIDISANITFLTKYAIMTETGHIVEETLLLMMVSTSLYSSAMITAYHNEEQESRKILNKMFPTFRKIFPTLKKKTMEQE